MAGDQVKHRVQHLSPHTAWLRRNEIADVYRAAFGLDEDQGDAFRDVSLINVQNYPGATVLIVEQSSSIIGFLYGYTYMPGHWWPDTVGPHLVSAGHGELLTNAFELLELAVLPQHQNTGCGSALLGKLLETTPHRHVLLNTAADTNNRAIALYQRFGFRVLLEGFRYIEFGDKNLIMAWSRNQQSHLHTPGE